MTDYEKSELTDIHLWKETDSNGLDHHYLYLEYLYRSKDEVYKYIYPKVNLGITSYDMPAKEEVYNEPHSKLLYPIETYLTFQNGQRYRVLPTDFEYITRYGEKLEVSDSMGIIEHLTKDLKKPKKNTKKEIEKVLGYEIELVDQ